jgi:cephalosporin-C deacetylase-like acetyl esterase
MMKAHVERRMKRWQEQRWILDMIVQSVGVEFDQPRLAYTLFPCGPDAIGDFRNVGLRVRKFGDMHREFAAAARRREDKAQAFEREGRTVAAREAYFIAALLWSAARWPIFESNPTSIGYNERMVACYDKYIQYAPRPTSRVEIPFGAKSLPAYLHLPREPKPGEKFPCVIGIDGMDASKEIMCSMYGDKFLERGFASFCYDGPGQGECTYRGVHVTATNHMDAAKAAYDWLVKHPNIDKDRLVVYGVSFGTFFGLQAAAALGDKIKGAGVAFVCHEPGANSIFNSAAPSFKLRFMYMSGYDDEAAFDEFMQGLTLEPIAKDIRCPVLIQAGEDDELSPIEFSHDLVAKMTCPRKIVVYEGDRHAIGGYPAAQLGENWLTMLADWCRDRVDGKPMKSESVRIDSLGRAHATPIG